MHQTQWSPERPLSPPVSLASQSHHEKPPEVWTEALAWLLRQGPEHPRGSGGLTHMRVQAFLD